MFFSVFQSALDRSRDIGWVAECVYSYNTMAQGIARSGGLFIGMFCLIYVSKNEKNAIFAYKKVDFFIFHLSRKLTCWYQEGMGVGLSAY